MKKPNRVAIIGAGIAGLSCATALQKAGFKVTVFEKSRGASGRISTRVTEQWQCDHGAQYFTARDPLFHAEVQRWIKADVARLWQPVLQVFDGNTFTAKANDEETDHLRYVGYPKNNAPGKWLAASLDVAFETTVTSIQKHANHWQVSSKEHGLYADNFDMLILCIPAPQAAALMQNTASELKNLCNAVTMRPCFALMVQLSPMVDGQLDGLFINSGLLSWAARDSSKPGRPQDPSHQRETWVLHASSDWSKTHVDDDKASVTQQMLGEFMTIMQVANLSNDKQATPIVVESVVLHRWLYADCDQYLTNVYAFDDEHKIGLCGDWLNGGKVQGAWLSGLMLANNLIEGSR